MQSYLKGMFERFGYMATWLPNAPLSLGDVGVLHEGSFQRVTSLRDLGIEFNVRRGSNPIDLAHSSDHGVSMAVSGNANAKAGPTDAKAKVCVELSSEGAFVFQAKGCIESSIEDQAKLGRELIARYKSGEDWDPDWVVINTVVEARSATILVSRSTSAKVEIGASGELPPGSVALAEADAGLRVLSQSGDVTNIIAQKSLKPLFRVSRIKRGLLARLKSSLFGETQVENVRTIGPQVFFDDREPAENGADDDALEEVKPE